MSDPISKAAEAARDAIVELESWAMAYRTGSANVKALIRAAVNEYDALGAVSKERIGALRDVLDA